MGVCVPRTKLLQMRLFVTLWIVAHQTPLPMGLSRQEYQSGLPCPPLGNLSNPGIEPTSLTSALAGRFFPTSATWKAQHIGDLWPIKRLIQLRSCSLEITGESYWSLFLLPRSHINSGGTTEAGQEILWGSHLPDAGAPRRIAVLEIFLNLFF